METDICPKTWMLESILVTVFCCLPFGIVGIVFAARVKSEFSAGNQEEATRLSNEAEKWTRISFICGILVYIFYFMIKALGSL